MPSPAPASFLVRMPNWLGDCVMALPALSALRGAFPEAHLAAQVREPLAALLHWAPGLDEVLPSPPGGGLAHLGAKWRYAGTLRQKKFAVGLLLPNSLSSAFWLWRAGVPRRIGTAANGRSCLLTAAVPLDADLRACHQAEWYLRLLAPLGLSPPLTPPRLEAPVQAPESEPPPEVAGGRYAVLAPGSAYGPAKDWVPERYARLAQRLVVEQGLSVFVTGSAADRPVAAAIAEQAGAGVCNTAGQTTLHAFLALLSGADLYVGNDSGATHCAAAFGVPTVALFGSTRPDRTRPLGPRVRCVVGEAPCAPCLGRVCRRGADPMLCMHAITVDRAWEAVAAVLSQAATGAVP